MDMLKTSSNTSVRALPNAANNSNFVILDTKLAFTKAPILYHFNPERYIQIEFIGFTYAIGSILSELIPKSGQWYPVACFSQKKILADQKYFVQKY